MGSFYFYYSNSNSKNSELAKVYINPFKFGLTNSCRKVPEFVSSLKMRIPSLDSRQLGVMGLVIRDQSQKNKVWQHESWHQSAYIGSFDRDQKGNIYVFPTPYVSLNKNPPKDQNQIYIIDAKTAEMRLFMKLPAESLPDSRNPFGVMGLYYDCDSNSLYVSTLAGSQPFYEKGAIYQIDLKTKTILSKLSNVDAIGLGTFNSSGGKRLYFGSARNSGLYYVNLNQKGNFSGEKHYESSLAQIRGGDSTVIKKISFFKRKKQYLMVLKEMEFGFRLLAENNLRKKKYIFEWNKKDNKWRFLRLAKE